MKTASGGQVPLERPQKFITSGGDRLFVGIGADTIKKILASLSEAALGVNDLRSAYGTGHGRPNRSSGLNSRHAHLAVQCSDAWVRCMLETLTLRKRQETGRESDQSSSSSS